MTSYPWGWQLFISWYKYSHSHFCSIFAFNPLVQIQRTKILIVFSAVIKYIFQMITCCKLNYHTAGNHGIECNMSVQRNSLYQCCSSDSFFAWNDSWHTATVCGYFMNKWILKTRAHREIWLGWSLNEQKYNGIILDYASNKGKHNICKKSPSVKPQMLCKYSSLSRIS